MLARERAAVADHQVGRLVHEGAELADALRRLQVEVDAHVDAALAEVAEVGGAVAVLVEQGCLLAQVVAQLLRGHGGVLPALPGGSSVGACAEAPRADSRTSQIFFCSSGSLKSRHGRRVGARG